MRYTADMKQPLHVSWLIMLICLGSILGVIGVAYIPVDTFVQSAWLGIGCLLGGIAIWRQRRWCILLAIVAGLCIGGWRASGVMHELEVYDQLRESTQDITGQVLDDAVKDKKGNVTFVVTSLQIDAKKLPGKLWVSTREKVSIMRSDTVTFRGVIGKAFANFSAAVYDARITHDTRFVHGDPALELRNTFSYYVRQAIHEPAASLGLGLLVGEKSTLPDDVAGAFRIASLTHIVVASGYNLTILVRLARRLCMRISKFSATAVSFGLIGSFIAITGLSPSMTRAGLVASLGLLAWYYGRKFHPFVLLAFAAAVTLLVNPSYGWNDLGWSLSFLSFAGVMIIAPVVQAYFFGTKKPGTIRQIIGETISAQIMTIPLIVASFGYISIVGVLANVIVVPFVPLAMLLTFITGVIAWAVPGLGTVSAIPVETLLDAMIAMTQYFARTSWATMETSWTVWIIVIFYSIIAVVWLWMWRATRIPLVQQNVVE